MKKLLIYQNVLAGTNYDHIFKNYCYMRRMLLHNTEHYKAVNLNLSRKTNLEDDDARL
jgi:hypothetical protein